MVPLTGTAWDNAVRRGTREDAEAVAEFLSTVWMEVYEPIYGSEHTRLISSKWHGVDILRQQILDPKFLFLVAEAPDSTGIAGHALAHSGKTGIVLHRLYCHRKFRNCGLGSAILDTVLAHMTGKVITVEVEQANTQAIAFYRRKGFVHHKTFDDEGYSIDVLTLKPAPPPGSMSGKARDRRKPTSSLL